MASLLSTPHPPFFSLPSPFPHLSLRRQSFRGGLTFRFVSGVQVIIEDNDDAERYVNAILDYFSAERPFTNLRDGDELYDENYPQALRQQGD